MFLACRQGQIGAAQRWAGHGAQLTAVLFRETSPAPLKYALSLLGLMSPQVRLPLVEVTDQTRAAVGAVMAHLCNVYPERMIGKVREFEHGVRRAAAG